jgi:hypothetical protein
MLNLVFWMMPAVAQAAPVLDVAGSCPGTLAVEISDSTPAGQIAILTATGEGATEVPAGPCVGAMLDVEGSVGLRGRVTADSLGGYRLSPTVGSTACGLAVQALDLTTCEGSRVVYTPESTAEYMATEGPLTDYDVDGGAFRLTLADDDVSAPIELGFSFTYYGEVYDTVQVVSNGGLYFGEGHVDTQCCAGGLMPEGLVAGTAYGEIMHVAGWWSDLNPTYGGFVSYDFGEADTGERFFMVDFFGIYPYAGSSGTDASEESFFQMVIFEGGAIELRVLRGFADASFYTVGYQNDDGMLGESLFYAAGRFLESTTYRIEPVL